ncbi:BLUF domain-containing protein [Roseomonas sp. CCTCC AB2023176]|uniref:BLUF domain-containing protein n=1 Tax=Roseomonas sp. CCTCC AB2023176 TaxID=3342640 RepID=UPI0035D56EFC
MPRSLHRLIYSSRNRIEGPVEGHEAAVRQILAVSRRNNLRDGVTGALMFNAGCFAQVLEGPRETVEATFERIQSDPRHGDVLLLSFARVETRAFPDWSMAFVGAGEAGARLFAGVATESGFDPARLSGEDLFDLLHERLLEEEYAEA